jgi:hypothetical protein
MLKKACHYRYKLTIVLKEKKLAHIPVLDAQRRQIDLNQRVIGVKCILQYL